MGTALVTPAIFEELTELLNRQSEPLSRLHSLALDAGSTWSIEQLHLMLACMEGIELAAIDDEVVMVSLGQRTFLQELHEAIIEVVNAQGQMLPAVQIKDLLPARFTTSVEQIKKLARESKVLKVVGPGLVGFQNSSH
jgi:hypothetical protein